MTVYKIRFDFDNCQCFFLADKALLRDRATSPVVLECCRRLANWKPPEVYIREPLKQAGDFYDLHFGGQLIMSPLCKYHWAIQFFLGDAGEMLPIIYEGREYKMLNVLRAINCLNQDKSEWFCTRAGERVFPTKFVFHPDRFGGSSIFKIPELLPQNLTIDRYNDPDRDFKAAYDHYGLTGLVFEPIWEG